MTHEPARGMNGTQPDPAGRVCEATACGQVATHEVTDPEAGMRRVVCVEHAAGLAAAAKASGHPELEPRPLLTQGVGVGAARWEDQYTTGYGVVIWTKEETIALGERALAPAWLRFATWPIRTLSGVTLLTTAGLYVAGGWQAAAAASATIAAGLVGWRHGHRESFDRLIGARARAALRRWMIYNRHWSTAMDRVGLGCRDNVASDRRRRPQILRTTAGPHGDMVLVELLPRQSVDSVTPYAEDLARIFGQSWCRVREHRPATVLSPAQVWFDFTQPSVSATAVNVTTVTNRPVEAPQTRTATLPSPRSSAGWPHQPAVTSSPTEQGAP